MFNIKWGIISGVVAFILAFAVSLLLGHSGISIAILRAFLFAVVFFALGIGVWALINSFLPELLSPGAASDAVSNVFSAESPGSRVNITLGDTSGIAVPGTNQEAHSIDEVGNIADLVSGVINPAADARKARDIDQSPVSGYTDEIGDFAPVPGSPVLSGGKGDFFMDFSGFMPGSSGLSELDSLSDSPSGSGESGQVNQAELTERKVAGNKPMAFEGDFSPKEIAAGIRTVLEKDKKKG